MYPAKFDYKRANSVEEAIQLKQQNAEAKFLAGGHSLLPVMKLRLSTPEMLIDIGRISNLKGILVNNGTTRIGALTTHSMVEKSTDLPDILPETASWIGDPMVRNRGTVGGNVSHADPASDWPTVFTALGATFHIQGPNGSRTVAAEDFFTGLFETALREDELLTAVEIPSKAAGTGSAYAKLFNPASRYPMLGAAAVLQMDGKTCTSARIAIGSLTPHAQRCPSVEGALRGQKLTDEVIQQAAAAVASDLGGDVIGDIHASAGYRREMAPVFIARAVKKAAERAG